MINESGRSAMMIGAYAGIIIDVYFLNGTPQTINITNSRLKFLGRLLITLFFFLIEYFLSIQEILSMTHGDMLEGTLIDTLPCALLLMFMYSYLKVIFKYFNLINLN
jgi:hypothetical protein